MDDEEALQKTLGEFLQNQGYTPLSALDGDAGFFARQRKKAGSYPFRLDNAQKNGFDVLKLLKIIRKQKIFR